MNVYCQVMDGVSSNGANGTNKRPPVVLLHGAMGSSQTWIKLGTMQLIATMGHRAIGVDLPGWGKSDRLQILNTSQRDRFLRALFKSLKVKQPMLVVASMSGNYALPYMMLPQAESCSRRSSALLALAPVSTNRFSSDQYRLCDIPALIIYGTMDKGLGVRSATNLQNMVHSRVMPIDGADHHNFLHKTVTWHPFLYNFLLLVEQTPQRR